MTTFIQPLQKEDGESCRVLHDLCMAIFLDGECYAFATALNRGLGWPMVGLMDGTQVRHAAVRAPDGRLHDVRGYISEEELGRPFGLPYPYTLKVINEGDLTREGESQEAREESIARARKMAEALWQELPWKDSYASRVLAFTAELEAISRKHKLWIRSQTPASFPMIALGEDDEAGYRLRPTFVGHFGIDRYFKDDIDRSNELTTSLPMS